MFLAWYLVSGRSRLKLNFQNFTFQRDMFLDILKVGAISCLSPLQSVLTILIFTKILAGFGTVTLAGYGMGSRLEFLLIPIAFAYGVASVPLVGMAMGAGLVARARRVAWTAGAAAGLTVGLVGLIASNFHKMALAKELMSRNAPMAEVSREAKVSPYKTEFFQQMNRIDLKKVRFAIKRIAEVDLAIKTSSGTPILQLEHLICELTSSSSFK